MAYDIDKIRKDNAILRKYAIIQKAQKDVVSVQTAYIDMTGDLEAALVLDELIFFTLPRDGGKSGLRVWKDGVLWMAVSRAEWWERKRLKPRQADTAIEKLLEQDLIFKSVHKFNGVNTVHIRLNVEKFFSLLAETLEKSNPPESEDDTTAIDIADLYEMMGGSGLQNSDLEGSRLQKRDLEGSRLQNGDEGLQNGEILNNPNNNPNINNPTETQVFSSANSSAESKPKYGSEEWKKRGREELAKKHLQSALIMGAEITQDMIDESAYRESALNGFEQGMGFNPLPWGSTKKWEKLESLVIEWHKKDALIWSKYKTWQKNEGKYLALSNKKIRENPDHFVDCFPDFLAHYEMYSTPEPPVDLDGSDDDFDFKDEIYI